MSVFEEVYEVLGAAKKRARNFAAAREMAHQNQWALVKSLGAVGFRPDRNGRIGSLIFDKNAEAPRGLIKIGMDGDRPEYRPSHNTKRGRELAKVLAEAPRIGQWREFADTFGWGGRSPIDLVAGRSIVYWCDTVHLMKPRERFFVTFPRELDDGWRQPQDLKLVRKSVMLRAIEDHNAFVRKGKKRSDD